MWPKENKWEAAEREVMEDGSDDWYTHICIHTHTLQRVEEGIKDDFNSELG